MTSHRYPSLYQINSRVWLTELSHALGRPATLDDIPDAELDRLATQGFDWIWFLSVWQTGPAARAVSRSNAGWRKEFQETLPDLKEKTSAAPGLPSKTTPCIAILAGTPRWHACANGCKNAD